MQLKHVGQTVTCSVPPNSLRGDIKRTPSSYSAPSFSSHEARSHIYIKTQSTESTILVQNNITQSFYLSISTSVYRLSSKCYNMYQTVYLTHIRSNA